MATVSSSVGSTAEQWNGQGHVQFSPDGTAICFYYNGTNWVYRTASAPYTSWSSATTVTGSINPGSFAAINDGAGNIHVVYKITGGPVLRHRVFTWASGSWTMGSANNVTTSGDYANDAAPVDIAIDSDGRVWVHASEWVGGYNSRILYAASPFSSWTSYFNGNGLNNNGHATYVRRIGNSMIYPWQSGNEIRWRRWTTNGSVGTISSQSVYSNGANDDWSSDAVADGNGILVHVMAASFGNEVAIRTDSFNNGTGAWTSRGDIGTAVQDRWPCAVVNPTTGNVYCVWSEYASSTSYAIVYKEWDKSTLTWGSKQTVQAAGAERVHINAICNGTTLLIVCTNVTSSLVESFAVTVGASGGSMSGAVMTASAAALNATMRGGVVVPGAVATASALSLNATIRGGASAAGAVMTASALSPAAAFVTGASVPAQTMTASAISPNATISARGLLSGQPMTAVAALLDAAIRGAAVLGAQTMTASAVSPNAALSAATAGTLTSQTMTATAVLLDAAMRGNLPFLASIMTAGAASPSAALVGSAVMAAQPTAASALMLNAAITAASAGALAAGLMTASGSAPDAVIRGGAILAGQTALASAASPIAAFVTGARMAAAVLPADAIMLVATVTGQSIGSGSMAAQPMLASATMPDSTWRTGAVFVAGLATASAISPNALFNLGYTFAAQVMTALAASPNPAVTGGARITVAVMAATAVMLDAIMVGAGPPTGQGQYYFRQFILRRRG